jgi:PPP family 3-phenylpropionic acid transporter
VNTSNNVIPYWRLSGFYLFYFASLGAMLPYWSAYLFSLGFDARAIGELVAILMLTKIISPNVWGWIADHTGKRMVIVRFGSLCAIITFTAILFVSSYWWIALVMLGYSFFWNATLPQFEATTFSHLGSKVNQYSSIRLWGSVGFILSVWILGLSIEQWGVNIVPYTLIVLFISIWVMSLVVPESAAGHLSLDNESLKSILQRPTVVGLLLSCFLMQASHGAYYVFFTPYMTEHGYSMSSIGSLWAFGVVAEVIVFIFMNRLLHKFSLRNLILFSLLVAVFRWALLSIFVDYFFVVILIQIMHAATFGIYHVAAIHLIHIYFPGRHQGKGQALYSSLSFGAGGALGSYISGVSWDVMGSSIPFLIATGLALAGFVISFVYVKDCNKIVKN